MNLKIKPKLLLITAAVLFFTYSCVKPLEPDLPESELTIVSLDSDPKLLDLIFTTNIKFEETSSFQLKGSANQETFSIFDNVNWDEVTKVENSEKGFTSYAAYYMDDKSNERKNLIIMETQKGNTAFMIKYLGTDEWFAENSIKHNINTFSGTMEIINRSGIVVAKSKFKDGVSFIPQQGTSQCNTWVKVEYEDVWGYYGVDDVYTSVFASWSVSEYQWCDDPSIPRDNPVEYIARDDEDGNGGGGGDVPISEPIDPDKPCPGLPKRNIEIASQSVKGSGLNGGLYGPTRKSENEATGELEPKWHRGIDIKTVDNEKIYSMFPGTVSYVGYDDDGLGHYVVIRSDYNGRKIRTYYGHLKANVAVKVGDKIGTSSMIGNSGTSGNLKEAMAKGVEQHIHIAIRDSSVPDKNVNDNPKWEKHPYGNKINPADLMPGLTDENGNLIMDNDGIVNSDNNC